MQTDNGKIEKKNTAGIATKETVIGVEKICYFFRFVWVIVVRNLNKAYYIRYSVVVWCWMQFESRHVLSL